MKFLLCLVATIIVVSSAPTHVKEGKADRPLPLRRVQKRSNPVFPYQTPCEAARAAAASSAVPVIAPPTGYHFLPDERYAYPYAYDLPYYREDQDSETLQFSDMDPMMSRNIPVHHYPTSRSYQPHHQYAGIPSMPSLAVFPGTESRKGCGGVPLLFSCSPSIVQGHLGHAHPYYNYQEQTPVHGYPEYHYEDSVLYRQGMPELMDEERNINHLGHQLTMAELQAINQQAAQQQALQQQALQQQALQQHAQHQHALHQQALSQQAQEEQLMNHNQHQQKSTQQKNDKPAEPTSQADSQQDLSLTS